MPGIVSTEAESRTGRARGAGKSKHPAPDGVKALELRVTGLWKGQAALLRVVRVVGMERVWGEGEPKQERRASQSPGAALQGLPQAWPLFCIVWPSQVGP